MSASQLLYTSSVAADLDFDIASCVQAPGCGGGVKRAPAVSRQKVSIGRRDDRGDSENARAQTEQTKGGNYALNKKLCNDHTKTPRT